MLRHEHSARIGKLRRIGAAVFEPAENAQDGAGFDLLAFRGEVAQDLFHRAELVTFAVNDEIALVAQQFDVPAQNANAERMERADGWTFRLFAVAFLSGR